MSASSRRHVTVCVADAGTRAAVRGVTPESATVIVATRDEAAATTGRDDVILVGAGVRLTPGWLDALLAALGDDGTVATVDAVVLDVAEPAVAETPGSRTRIESPAWACTLVTRAALDLAGPLDEGFAARCTERGLRHVLVSDVVAAGPAPKDDAPGPIANARARGRALSEGHSVTIDARILRDPVTGTQVHTLELLAALARTPGVHVRALVPPEVTPTAAAVLDRLTDLELLDSSTVDDDTPATPIVHRPYQVSDAIDLLTLRQVGERLVVTHQDLLNFHVPAYHEDEEAWREHRRLTALALEAAHATVAFSQHAAADLLDDQLVRPERLHVVPIGVDHRLAELAAEPRRPDAAAKLDDAPYLLCIGTDLRHKNRPFAIALLAALRERHGWEGRLAFAGPHTRRGSSAREERALLEAAPELAGRVVDIGVPDEAEKAWLYAHAAAVVYPTTFEGFGLIPFEAATHGTPCLFAAQAALVETVGVQATLVPWDAAASADRVVALLTDGPERAAFVAAVRAVGEPLTWDRTAAALLDVYTRALEVSDTSWAGLEADAQRGHWEGMYWALRNEIGDTGMALVGADGLLPEAPQRTLAGLLRRSVTRRPVLGALNALGRLGGERRRE